MPYKLSYTIQPFTGAPDVVTNVAADSLAIDASGRTPEEGTVVADGATGILVTGAVTLNIRIVDTSRNSVYYPVGLAVQPTASGQRPPSALFPLASVSPTDTTTIVLQDNDVPGIAETSYEFVVLFQAVNGNFGILDPRISNS